MCILSGGALQLVELSRMLQASGQTLGMPSTTAIIYDSVPGKPELSSALSAFLAPVRSTLVRILMSIPLTIVYYVLVAIAFITRRRSPFERMRSELNKGQVLPWTTEETPRLYIYSDTDKLVNHKHVAEHIANAKELGLNVRGEYFKGSPHVAHARADPDRYWDAIRKVWVEAIVS